VTSVIVWIDYVFLISMKKIDLCFVFAFSLFLLWCESGRLVLFAAALPVFIFSCLFVTRGVDTCVREGCSNQ
jgi:hypothetical protein